MALRQTLGRLTADIASLDAKISVLFDRISKLEKISKKEARDQSKLEKEVKSLKKEKSNAYS